MSGYTYDARQDYAGFETLTEPARNLGDLINREARETGGDRLDLLRESAGTGADKAALADLWGGPGAGEEFLR